MAVADREYSKARSEAANKWLKEQTARGREIGEPELPGDPPSDEARERGRRSLAFFCKDIFPGDFCLEWSDAHLKAIARLESSIREGGTFALAMPRGSGKSSLARAAALWAIFFNFRQFVIIVGAEQTHASEMVDALKTDLESNDRLFCWFPKTCHSIRCLEGTGHAAKKQTYQGERTRITWAHDKIVFPKIDGEASSECVIASKGIGGRIRGQFYKRAVGETIRPDFAILDDPQTDESARSIADCDKRERVIGRAVLRAAGPTVEIAAVTLCTVIRRDDLADRLLNRDQNPHWRGQKTKMLISFPDNTALWEGPYLEELIRGYQEAGEAFGEEPLSEVNPHTALRYANAFYTEHREAMDMGAVVSWDQRMVPGELSAIQHAMNLWLKDRPMFAAEMQQEPDEEGDVSKLTEEIILAKVAKLEVGVCLPQTEKVVAFIDVQGDCLFWMVASFGEHFTGHVIAYGSWPQQTEMNWSLDSIRITLQDRYEGGPDAAIHAGLAELSKHICRHWDVEDGGREPTSRLLIDAGWNSRIIREFLRETKLPNIYHSYGRGITAGTNPLNQGHKRKGGDLIGSEWRVAWTSDSPRQKHVLYDTNHWKSFVVSRMLTNRGDRGCITLHSGDRRYHRMLIDHLLAEAPVKTEGRGREVQEWRIRPGRSDNHYLDCLVGCCVAASIEGIKLQQDLPTQKRRNRSSFQDALRKRRG